MVNINTTTSQANQSTVRFVRTYFRCPTPVDQFDVYVVIFNNGTRRAFSYLNTVPQGEVDPNNITAENGYRENNRLYQLYMDYMNGGNVWSEEDRIQPFLKQFFDGKIEEVKPKTSLKKDLDGNYWIDVDGKIAPLKFEHDQLTADLFMFMKFTIPNTAPTLLPVSQEEQTRLISQFGMSEETYGSVYPLVVLHQLQPTEIQRRELIETGRFAVDEEYFNGTLYQDEQCSRIDYFSCIGDGSIDPSEHNSQIGYREAVEEVNTHSYFWLNAEDSKYEDGNVSVFCQLGVVALFGPLPGW